MSKKPAKPRTANHFIREWRLHRRMTQEKLGEEIDMTSGGLSQLENGVVNYTQPTLEAIAKALTCAPRTLLLVEPTVKSEESIIFLLRAILFKVLKAGEGGFRQKTPLPYRPSR